MIFESIGLVNDYARRTQMLSKWQRKKQSGSYRSEEGGSASERWRQKKAAQDQQLLQSYRQQQEDKDTLLADIHNKLASGQKLTPEEKAYLREKDPRAYQMLEEEELEKKSYEAELRRSKTKEEAQRVETNHAMASLAKVKSVDSNSNIPDEVKISIFWSENRKAQYRAEIMRKFVASGEYEKLPTVAEEQKAREDLRAAERQEQEERTAERKGQEEERAEQAEQERELDAEVEQGLESELDAGSETAESSKAPGEAKPLSRMEATNTREAVKVRRSRLNKLKKKFTEVGVETSSPRVLSAKSSASTGAFSSPASSVSSASPGSSASLHGRGLDTGILA